MRKRLDLERWAGPLVFAAAVGLGTAIVVGGTTGLTLAGLAAVLLVLSCYSAEDGFLLMGPYLQWELTRYLRRSWMYAIRMGFIIPPAIAVLVLSYMVTVADEPKRITRTQSMLHATIGFFAIGYHLFLASLVILSQNVGTAITDDRESRRQDFLLSSDLRGREMVIGKAMSRLLVITGYPLAILPFVAALPLLFAVDPVILVLSIGYAMVTLLSLASVTILCSVLAKDKKATNQWAAVIMLPYLFLTMIAGFLQNYPAIWQYPGTPTRTAAFTVGDAIELISVGNPLTRFKVWAMAAASNDFSVFEKDFPGYAAFHIVFGILGMGLASRWIRPVSLEMAGGDPPPREQAESKLRPAVTDAPVIWKEQHCQPNFFKVRGRSIGKPLILLLVCAPAIGILLLGGKIVSIYGYDKEIQFLSLAYVMLFTAFFMISLARQMLESVPRERQQDTLLSLILTDLTPTEILHQKAIGALRLCLPIYICFLFLGGLCAAVQFWPWWLYLGVSMMCMVYALFLLAIAAWCGVASKSIDRASRVFAFYLIALLLVPPSILGMLMLISGDANSPVRYLFPGFAGPISFTMVQPALKLASQGDFLLWLGGTLLGAMTYLLGAYGIWRASVKRFNRVMDPGSTDDPLLNSSQK